jgi:hypothetical protein
VVERSEGLDRAGLVPVEEQVGDVRALVLPVVVARYSVTRALEDSQVSVSGMAAAFAIR